MTLSRVLLLLWSLIISCLFSDVRATRCTFPSSELSAIHDFYFALGGESWHWSNETNLYGIPWNFTANYDGNPCTDFWQGIQCSYFKNDTAVLSAPQYLYEPRVNATECHVYQVSLTQFGLVGQIPSSLANLTYLKALQLPNNSISGTIDAYLWNLSRIESFIIDDNMFTGAIPLHIDFTQNLTALSLTENLLEGSLPDSLCDLAKLNIFAVSSTLITGTIPDCINMLTQLDTFTLSFTSVEGSVPIGICSWPNIRDFSVDSNLLNNGSFPTCFGESGSLQYINISFVLVNNPLWPAICDNSGLISFTAMFSTLSGQLPLSCFDDVNAPNFTSLNLGWNLISGTIPYEYWSDISSVFVKKNLLTGSIPGAYLQRNLSLREFVADKNHLTGSLPNSLAHTNISVFSILDNQFTGILSDELCMWTSLVSFQVQQNFLNGSIPACVSNWKQLQLFNLNSNQLTGTIPEVEICAAWSDIRRLDFSHNYFTGTLPDCFGYDFPLMTDFSVEYDYFHGTLPESYCLWKDMQVFSAELNHQFSGTIPACYGNWTKIERFFVAESELTGSLSDTFCAWTEILAMGINDNHLTGSIPECVGNMTKFAEFYALNNQLSGTLPVGVCNWDMQFIQLYLNQFSGSLPDCIRWDRLTEMYIWGNQFTGTISSHWCEKPYMQTFDIRNNSMNGTLPSCMWKLPVLHLLVIEQNQFTGPLFLSEDISCGSGNQSDYYSHGLRYITASDNYFTGRLPSCIGNLFPSLESLGVGANNLQGSIPDSLCKLTNLYDLQAFASQLTGTFPDCWSELQTNLEQISVSDNQLRGNLPTSVCNLKSLVSLLLGNNEFTGSIPPCYGDNNMQHMNYFNISFNQLTGRLSDSLCGMNQETIFFALNNNALKGSIPSCFGSFEQLQFLYLSDNQLTGSLSFLRNQQGAPLLVELVIADNKLTGPIFMDLANKSVDGKLKRSLTQIIAQHNYFTGYLPSHTWQEESNISLHDAFGLLHVVDISQNKIKGKVDPTLFQVARSLTSVVLIKNCFSGQLSAGICLHGESKLQVLALDGLSAGCSQLMPRIVHGSIPSCVFTLPYLQTFHAAGNNFDGSLPDVASSSSNLTDLSLSHNNFRGTIPTSMQRRSWINLDLAFNKLAGSLVDSGNDSQWAVPGRSVKLNRNRLSGNVPSQYVHADDIDMLNGNLFSCKLSINHRGLPENDVNVDNYSCGTVSLNLMLLLGAGLGAIVLAVCMWFYFASHTTLSSSSKAGVVSAQEQSLVAVTNQYQLSLSSIVYNHGEAESEQDSDDKERNAYSSKNESLTSSEIRREEDVTPTPPSENEIIEHKADDPAHPANQIMMLGNKSNNKGNDLQLGSTMKALSEQFMEAANVLYADILILFQMQSQATKTTALSSGLSPWAHAAPNDYLTHFLQISDHQRRIFITVWILSVMVLMPGYFALSYFYKTHSSSYAWIISAAYIGGVIPALVLLVVWIVLFLWLYSSLDPNLRLRDSGTITVMVRKAVQRLYQLYAFWQEYSIIAAALLMNAVLLLAINGVYVYLVIHNGRAVSISLQIALVMFKLVYNSCFVSSIIRGSEWLQRLRKRQRLLKKGLLTALHDDIEGIPAADVNAMTAESLLNDNETLSSEAGDGGLIPGIYSEAALVIFNLVIVPIVATLCVDSNCFSELLVPPTPLDTQLMVVSLTPSYRFALENQVAAFSSSLIPVQTVVETQFSPPFTFSGQCASSVIATYEPVFVLLYLTFLFFLPLAKFILRAIFKQDVLQWVWLVSDALRKPDILRLIGFDRRSFVVTRVTNIAILMTFGWVFPPLAALITIVEIRDLLYLVGALRRYIASVGGITAAEKDLGIHFKGVASSLPYLQLRYLPLGAICLGMLLYDIVADQVGLIAAIWAPLLMTIGLWLLDHILLMRKRQAIGKQQQREGGGSVYVIHCQDAEEEEATTTAAYTPSHHHRHHQTSR